MAIIRALASGSRSTLRAQNLNASTLTQAALKPVAFKGKIYYQLLKIYFILTYP